MAEKDRKTKDFTNRSSMADADATSSSRPSRKRKVHVPPTPIPVDRIDASSLTDETFFLEYVLPNRPIVIRGAIDHWPALHKWSREYFEKNHSSQRVNAAPLPPSGANVWFDNAAKWSHEPEELPGVRLHDRLLAVSGMRHEMEFGELLQRLHNKPSEGETLWYADGGGNMEKDFGFLCDDIGKPGRSDTQPCTVVPLVSATVVHDSDLAYFAARRQACPTSSRSETGPYGSAATR